MKLYKNLITKSVDNILYQHDEFFYQNTDVKRAIKES
jgi:hypothetical protein